MDSQKMPSWICFDLHMHSFSSRCDRKTRVNEMSADDFVSILFNNGIDVFSVTDHNCFDAGYYEDLKKSAASKGMKVIYGSELNVYVKKEKGGQTHFQMGVYFDDQTDTLALQKALEELYVLGEGNYATKFPNLSEIMEKLFTLKTGFIVIPEANGLGDVYKDVGEDFRKRMQNDGFQRVFSGYHAGDSFNKTSAENWAYSFYQLTQDFDELTHDMSSESIVALTKELKKKIKDETAKISEIGEKLYAIVANYAPDYAYLHFSDWHNAEEYKPKYKNYLFGDKEVPFDTLALACDDPQSRIVTKLSSEARPIITGSYLKELRFTLNGKEKPIYFTPGLNAIVGQRGLGKSFLLSIIKQLSSVEDKSLSKYETYFKVDHDSIRATTYGGEEIKAGNLAQVSFINQNEITKIYENPKGALAGLKSYFPDSSMVDFSGLTEIKNVARTITVFNKSYRSFTPYLTFDTKISSFSYAQYPKINMASIQNGFANAITSVNSLITDIKNSSLSAEPIEKIADMLGWQKERYEFLCSSYNSVITTINDKINEYRQAATFDESIQKQMSSLYREGMGTITHNFDILLSCKKLVYLLKLFSPEIPKYAVNKHEQFIFVSGYRLSSDSTNIRDELFGNLTESINRGKFRGKLDNGVFVKYANGEVALKSGRNSICDGLDDEFESKVVTAFNYVYEIKDDTADFESLISGDELKSLEDAGAIDNITNSSPGKQSVAYISIVIGEDKSILVFDQPEDNIDNVYISEKLVPLLKQRKMNHQLIFVTHNPSVAVYTDAFNYIFVDKDGADIDYQNRLIERRDDKEKIMQMLDGGRKSFSNRNLKYGEVLGGYSYGKKANN